MSLVRGLLSKWRRTDPERKARDRLYAIDLRRGDVAIDCGANVGKVTAKLARRGATVYAFEPNPYAFAALADRFKDSDNVHCRNEAVLDEEGSMNLYLHEHSDDDPVKWSTASSLMATKSNVNRDAFVTVKVTDLARFIALLGQRIKLLKIDVEGVECRLLQHLIDTGLIERIDHVFVEMHESRMPELQRDAEQLRRTITERGLDHVHLDWP